MVRVGLGLWLQMLVVDFVSDVLDWAVVGTGRRPTREMEFGHYREQAALAQGG